jgi:hypothetical protein
VVVLIGHFNISWLHFSKHCNTKSSVISHCLHCSVTSSNCGRSSVTAVSGPSHKKVEVTWRLTVSQSVCLGVDPHLGLITRYLLLFDSYGLLLLGALSDERTGLSFVHAAGSCQRNYCLRYETSFSSPPMTRRVTVEVFEPASTRSPSHNESWSSLYSLGTDCTENTASNSLSLPRHATIYEYWDNRNTRTYLEQLSFPTVG